MKRPSFQFYPGDWQSNSNLRRCTHAEKGAWLDVMCLLHDQPEYGVLRWPLKEIAQAIGAPMSLLQGLITKGVLKGDDKHIDEPFVYTPRSGRKDGEPVTLVGIQDGPAWYSSRMVRDEYVRTIRGESSRFGAAPDDTPNKTSKASPKHAPKPPFSDGSSSSSSSSSSNTPIPPDTGGLTADAFEQFWRAYPKKIGKDAAQKAFARRKPDKPTLEAMLAAVSVQAASDQWRRDGGQFVPNPATWLNQGRWKDGENSDAPAVLEGFV